MTDDNKELPSSPYGKCGEFLRTYARLLLATLTFATTILATWYFVTTQSPQTPAFYRLCTVVLFAVLFFWVSMSFWTASMGLCAILFRGRDKKSKPTIQVDKLPRTALLMPIYNEDPQSVFAGIRAIMKSLGDHGAGELFDVFVLSDSTDPDIWLEEERQWAKISADPKNGMEIYYRHRPKNVSRKSGNIADFCNRWGERYKYMVVLDADSLMTGDTLKEMVYRMEKNPKIGILQVPPKPVNRQSFFARMQQFATAVYGPVFLEGLALWCKEDGNYWGHNAIIRVAPFMEHSDLPILPGKGPLGGEILSHDFVEAALMRRAGWKVCLAHDLDGSYEECPTTMLGFAQRDQRWCQGNMQHMRLLLADGFHPISRLHLSMGIMSYLASPLWLLFVVLTMVQVMSEGDMVSAAANSGLFLFSATLAMLLLPKLWGVIALARDPGQTSEMGGWKKVVGSVLIETIVSVLIAPIMMLLHSGFVLFTLVGHRVTWNAQSREDSGVPLRCAVEIHWLHTLTGLFLGFAVWTMAPSMFLWLSPILLGLVLSIPLCMLVSSVEAGRALEHWGLLTIPEESNPPAVLHHKRNLLRMMRRDEASGDRIDLFDLVLRDPSFYALHVGILRATDGEIPMPPRHLEHVVKRLRRRGAKSISSQCRRAVLNDATALKELHILSRSQTPKASSKVLS